MGNKGLVNDRRSLEDHDVHVHGIVIPGKVRGPEEQSPRVRLTEFVHQRRPDQGKRPTHD